MVSLAQHRQRMWPDMNELRKAELIGDLIGLGASAAIGIGATLFFWKWWLSR